MSERAEKPIQDETRKAVKEHASESQIREAILRLKEIRRDLPEIDAVAFVRAGRSSSTT